MLRGAWLKPASQVILQALAMERFTALRKPDGGVRGIAKGDVFRSLGSAHSRSSGLPHSTAPHSRTSLHCKRERAPTPLRRMCALPRQCVLSQRLQCLYDSMSRAACLS